MINIPGSFQPVTNLMFDNVARLAMKLEDTAGSATLTFGPLPSAGTTPTGLLNTTALYYVKHQLNAAGTATEVSFAGSTAQTFNALVVALQSALGAGVVVALVGGDIVITSTTLGNTSRVVITSGTTGADLLTSIRHAQSVNFKASSSKKGFTTYLRWDQLDALEQTELRTIMNTLDPADTEWTFTTAGLSISTDAAGTLSMFSPLAVATNTYTLNVTVDGTLKTVSFKASNGAPIDDTFEAFAVAMSVAFPTAEVTATQVDVDTVAWMVTSPTAGATGAVVIAAGSTGVDFIATVSATSLLAAVIAPVAGVTGIAGTLSDGTPIAATAGRAFVTSDVAVAATDIALYGPGIATLGAITGGSGYTNGTYNGVALTGGSGTGATANITVTAGAVSAVTLVAAGKGYTVANALSATAASIGGTGTGFSIPVATLLAATSYSFKVAVDGAATVEYLVAAATPSYTYTSLATLLSTAALVTAGVSVTFDDATDRFVFTRSVAGATSTVAVTAGTTGVDVFAQSVIDGAPTAYAITATAGTAAIVDASVIGVLATTKAPNGFPVLTSVGPTALFNREDKPAIRYIPKADGTYYNGTAFIAWTA